MTEDVGPTLEDAIALKKRLADERETEADRKWLTSFVPGGQREVVSFLNAPPAQGPGEAFVGPPRENAYIVFFYA